MDWRSEFDGQRDGNRLLEGGGQHVHVHLRIGEGAGDCRLDLIDRDAAQSRFVQHDGDGHGFHDPVRMRDVTVALIGDVGFVGIVAGLRRLRRRRGGGCSTACGGRRAGHGRRGAAAVVAAGGSFDIAPGMPMAPLDEPVWLEDELV